MEYGITYSISNKEGAPPAICDLAHWSVLRCGLSNAYIRLTKASMEQPATDTRRRHCLRRQRTHIACCGRDPRIQGQAICFCS